MEGRHAGGIRYKNTSVAIMNAEMGAIQGDSTLWTLKPSSTDSKPRIALRLEYIAKALTTGVGVRDCRSEILEAGYVDIAVNGYLNRSVAIPTFQSLTRARRPDGSSYQFLGGATATHGRSDY